MVRDMGEVYGKVGIEEILMRVTISKTWNMAMEFINGKVVAYIKDISLMIWSTGKEGWLYKMEK